MKFLRLLIIPVMIWMLFPAGAMAVGEVRTLAILPFENNSITDPEKYAPLSDGLAAMLITDLNKNDSILKVIERNKIKSILKEIALGQAGGVDQSTAIEAGKILGAQSIGFGSFTVMGDMMRIDIRIVKVETSELIMAEAVNGDIKNFLALEMGLAAKIAKALKTVLEVAPQSPKSSIEAALFFSKGIDALDQGNAKEAQTMFNQAITLDPKYKIQVQAIN